MFFIHILPPRPLSVFSVGKIRRVLAAIAALCALFTASCKAGIGGYSFAVMPKSLLLPIGVTYKLETEWPPGGTALIKWSSDSGSATVDSAGNVTGASLGFTLITVKALDGDGGELASSQCEVTVIDEGFLNEFRITPPAFQLANGTSYKLEAEGAPGGTAAVSWSSDSGSATVDSDGNVTGRGLGLAIITANALDANGGDLASATCEVTVTAGSAAAFVVIPASLSLTVGGAASLSTLNQPNGTTDISWSSDSGSALVNTSGTVTALSAGVATITATANAGGLALASATCEVTIPHAAPPAGPDADTLAVLVQSGTTTEIYLKTPIFTADNVINTAIALANTGTTAAPSKIKLIAGKTYTLNARIETGGKNLQISTYSSGTATINRNGNSKTFSIISHASGTLVLGDGVAANKVMLDGGGGTTEAIDKSPIFQSGGTVTLKDGAEITGGTSSGVTVGNATFKMEGGVIRGNKNNKGAGLFCTIGGTFKKTGGTIYGNDGTPNANTASASRYKGDAVFVLDSSQYRDATAGPAVNLDSSNGTNWGQ